MTDPSITENKWGIDIDRSHKINSDAVVQSAMTIAKTYINLESRYDYVSAHFAWLRGRVEATATIFDENIEYRGAANEIRFLTVDYAMRHMK